MTALCVSMWVVSEDLVELCPALGGRTFSHKALDLLERTAIQEEQVVYTAALLEVEPAACTPELRERLLRFVAARVTSWKGGPSVRHVRESTLASCLRLLPETEKQQFAQVISSANKSPATFETTARVFVRAWKMQDFSDVLVSRMEKTCKSIQKTPFVCFCSF
jgi:hypothetical protein